VWSIHATPATFLEVQGFGSELRHQHRRSTTALGHTYAPLKNGLATILRYGNGQIDIRAWAGGPIAGPNIVHARHLLASMDRSPQRYLTPDDRDFFGV
jgi:hypothetical protein